MEHLWSDLQVGATATFTVGQTTLALASDMRRLTMVLVLDGLSSYRLTLLNKTQLKSRFPDFTAWTNQKPRFGYIAGTTLTVVPPPSEALTVDYTYYRLHPALANDAAILLITQADEAVIAFTTYRLFKAIQQHDDAKEWLIDYAIFLKDAISADRSPATELMAEPRGRGRPVPVDYWLDPFVQHVPGYSGYGGHYGY